MHVELSDLVALADKPEELPLGRRQRRVRHHVEQADMQFADVLMERRSGVENLLPLLAQTGESGQVVMGDDGHGASSSYYAWGAGEAEAALLAAQGAPVWAIADSIKARKSCSSRTWATSSDETV